jgi:hypothetical protein
MIRGVAGLGSRPPTHSPSSVCDTAILVEEIRPLLCRDSLVVNLLPVSSAVDTNVLRRPGVFIAQSPSGAGSPLLSVPF